MNSDTATPLGLSKRAGLEIHAAIAAGDPTAQAQLVTLVLNPLVRHLTARFPAVRDETLIFDAATDAIVSYLRNPQQFNPQKRSLSGYLKMSAEGDLKNALEKEQRRISKLTSLEVVEESIFARNIDMESGENDEAEESLALLSNKLGTVIKDSVDRRLVELMATGERKTNLYAEVLKISNLPLEQQRKLVKRHKDRLSKKLRRLGVKLSENPDER